MVTSSDIYSRVHKGLRRAMFELALDAGRIDYAEAEAWSRLKARAAEMIYFLERHGVVEETYFLPLLEAKMPGSTTRDAAEHEQVHADLAKLEAEMARIDALPAESRAQAAEGFYLMVNHFIADYLGHMHHEEVTTGPLFMEHCSQEELKAAHVAVIANNAPADTMMMLRHTLPSIDPMERATFLGAIRMAAPPPAFQAIMGVARGVLTEAEMARLESDLAEAVA